MDEWLPQRHLARFVVEVVDGLDLSEMVKAYGGSGSASPIRRQVRSRALWPDPSQPETLPGGPVLMTIKRTVGETCCRILVPLWNV